MTTAMEFEQKGAKFLIDESGKPVLKALPELRDEIIVEVESRARRMRARMRDEIDQKAMRRTPVIGPAETKRHGQCMTCGDPMEPHKGGMCALCGAAWRRLLKEL